MSVELKNLICKSNFWSIMLCKFIVIFSYANKQDMRDEIVSWLQQITSNEYLETM
jgi:hypothetical protein